MCQFLLLCCCFACSEETLEVVLSALTSPPCAMAIWFSSFSMDALGHFIWLQASLTWEASSFAWSYFFFSKTSCTESRHYSDNALLCFVCFSRIVHYRNIRTIRVFLLPLDFLKNLAPCAHPCACIAHFSSSCRAAAPESCSIIMYTIMVISFSRCHTSCSNSSRLPRNS